MHIILTLTDTCTGCFACANVCPKDAICLTSNFEGFYYPHIDNDKCVNCGLCDKVCPVLFPVQTYTMKRAYFGWTNDDTIRKDSSSGGLFYIMATQVLKENGTVYGASFNYDGIVRLECHSTQDVSLKELMKSKYVQSYIGFAYRDIKRDLKLGLKVQFCGTPCQVAGLKSFLGMEYKNLILIDFVCHGVPSMDLLQKHLEYLNIKNVVEINFRPKNIGWYDDFEIRYKKCSSSDKIILRKIPWMFDEYFYKLYSKNYSIRRSCKNCLYCNGQRAADITIGDFWGIKEYKPELWNSKGVSLLIANTEKAFPIISQLQKSRTLCDVEEMDTSYAIYAFAHNRKEKKSQFQNQYRDSFLSDVYSIGYKKALIKHNLRTTKYDLVMLRIKKNILGLLKKICNK